MANLSICDPSGEWINVGWCGTEALNEFIADMTATVAEGACPPPRGTDVGGAEVTQRVSVGAFHYYRALDAEMEEEVTVMYPLQGWARGARPNAAATARVEAEWGTPDVSDVVWPLCGRVVFTRRAVYLTRAPAEAPEVERVQWEAVSSP